MRFSVSIITLFLASAFAAPATEAPESSGLLQARCLANGGKSPLCILQQYFFFVYLLTELVECINDVNNCCSGLCAMDKGRATYVCY